MSFITSAGTNLSTLKNAQDHNLTPPMQTDILFGLLSLNYTAHRILQKKKILLPRSSPIWHYWFIHQRIWIWYWIVKKTIFKQLKRYRKPDFPLMDVLRIPPGTIKKIKGAQLCATIFVLATSLGFMMPKRPQSQITFLKLQNNLHQQARIQPACSAASFILAQTPDLSVAVL